MIQNADMRLESGTCNVCSAPCSSCMHLSQAFMGSKAEEFSDENCRLGEANNYTLDESDGSSHRSRACERLKHAVCETSKMPSVNSSHDSLTENAESTQTLFDKCQDSKCLEGLDGNTSCISKTVNTNLVSDSHKRNADRINLSCTSPSGSHLVAEGSGTGPSVNISGLSEILSSKDTDIRENSSECNVGNVDSSPTKEIAPVIVSGEKSSAVKDSLVNGTTAKVSVKIYPKSEPDTNNDVGDVKEDHKCSVYDGMREKLGEPVKPPDITRSEDESDESDIVEHDVKVCDICGDAGREDLLAICSRCSDGAEHTYCMREMLQKVPEGDWLCEECKFAEETENQRLDVEAKTCHKVSPTSQISGKRHPESIEVGTSAKRQALESNTGSPKASSPKRILSRESSFKNLDKGKLKPGHQTLLRNHPGGDDIELTRSLSTGPRSQTTNSTLLKSNSFNNFNSKPRVKLVDEVVPQKKKGSIEYTSKNMETPARIISKSMSFKSSNLGRSNATESKVKMISSKPGMVLDSKGSRLAKESGATDRKILSRIDRSMVSSTTASSVVSTSKGDEKLRPHGETTRTSAINNNREFKANQDGRLSSSSKSMNSFSCRSLEPPVSSERTFTSGDETQPDGLPQSRETANQVDIAKDSSSDRVRSGNAPEFSVEVSAAVPSSSKEEMHKDNILKAAIQAALLKRPSIYKKKEVPDRTDEFPTLGNDLNCKETSQGQLLVPSTPKNIGSSVETNVKQEIDENPIFQTSSTSDLKQLSFGPTDYCSEPRKSDSVGAASGMPVMMDIPNRYLTVSNVPSKISAFPEYEYIWQGVFQVHRSGKPPDLFSGIQAHLSTCASPKVLEVVNKFLPEISLNEVSRLSTWPSQFHQGGAKEDNIALYFFAKDIESYERHYKGLLDHMIRNDLAFKGIFDGVELLIFPSNQLPEDSQRWNRLFFLWGVFRGQRMNHSEPAKKICIPSLNAMPIENGFPTAVMTLSETRCSPTRMDEESVACGKSFSALIPSISQDRGHAMKDGQYRESKSPEGLVTGVSTSIVETKIDYDISVKQENLSSGIPSVAGIEIDSASNIKENQISDRMNNDDDQQRPKRKQIEDDLNIKMEETFQEDLGVKAVNFHPTNDKKVHHIDVSEKVMQASAVSYQKTPWNEVNGKLGDRESSSKRLKSGFSEIYGRCSSGGKESFNESLPSFANELGSSSSAEDKGCKEACDEKIIHEDFGAMERTFFPVDTRHKKVTELLLNSVQLQVGVPNLELALGGETKPQPQKGMLPFLVGAVDKKNNQEKPPDVLADEQEDESVAASLSLSLSFPSPNKEPSKPVPKAEHLPDGHHVNTSFLLFGRLTDQ